MEVNLYNQQGEEIGKVKLPAEVFDIPINYALVHQAVAAQQANSRRVIAHTKDRSERRGGGVKPWRQKGTGRARHGSIRSPIWRKGGVTFGPTKERNYSKKINKKVKRKALLMALTSKVKDQEMVVLDQLKIEQAKTKDVVQILNNLGKTFQQERLTNVLIVMPQTDKNVILSGRNLPKVKVIRADSLNPVDVLTFRNLILLKDSIKVIEETYLK